MKVKSFVFILVFAIAVLLMDIMGCESMQQVVKPPREITDISRDITIGVVLPQIFWV